MSYPITKQEIFDKVLDRLFDGNGQSVQEVCGTIDCMYLNPNGNKCAVGIFISKEDYRRDFEHNDVHGVLDTMDHKGDLFVFLNTFEDLLGSLQSVHDNKLHWEDNMPNKCAVEALYRIAKWDNLNTTKLEELK